MRSIRTGARADVINWTVVYGAHVGDVGIIPLRPGLGERRRLFAREHAARTQRAN